MENQNGILEGLLRKNLSAVQFNIVTGSKDPSNILESYTFSFQYSENENKTDLQLVGLTLLDPHGEPINRASAKHELFQIVSHLIKLNVYFPALPGSS